MMDKTIKIRLKLILNRNYPSEISVLWMPGLLFWRALEKQTLRNGTNIYGHINKKTKEEDELMTDRWERRGGGGEEEEAAPPRLSSSDFLICIFTKKN